LENLSDFNSINQRIRKLSPLDTRYFLPEERTLSDFLTLINRLSKQVNFFDEQLQERGDWFDFFISNELFLLAEIENFDLKSVEKEKTAILLRFERSDSQEEKSQLISQLFEQIKGMLITIDYWYRLSSEYNKKRESTTLENELVGAISYRCKSVYAQLQFLASELKLLNSPIHLEVADFNLKNVWETTPGRSTSIGWGAEILDVNYLLKQLLLLHRPVFKTIANLTERSKQLFRENLANKQDHEPHIGLLIAFFQLFSQLQEEMNTVPDRLLTYYFERILGQVRKEQEADTVQCYATIDEDIDQVFVPKHARLLAGQNDEGNDILYELKDPVTFSNLKLASLFTMFVSRNKLIDPGTPFQTVNGIYSKHIPISEEFKPFQALGEEQRFLNKSSKTMDEVDIGFSVSSPTLRLGGGYREVHLEFVFLTESYQYFLAMLLSISKTKNQLPEEVFHQIFAGSLSLQHTTSKGWCEVPAHEVIPPMSWNENSFKLAFTLGPDHPAISPYSEEVHEEGLNLQQPVLKILLKNQHVFHPYSFLQFLELEQIKIEVNVKQLKNLNLHSSFGPLDQSIPFDLLGPIPKVGSYLLIGNDEIFSKDLVSLQVGWTFHDLPQGKDMKSFYEEYPYDIENGSFKLKVQALSDFKFMPKEGPQNVVTNLFEEQDGIILSDRYVQDIDLEALQILPDYTLQTDEDEDEVLLSNQKTGFLKLELVSPNIGFGFDVYSTVYANNLTTASNEILENPKGGFKFVEPKEPFSPLAKDIYLDYSSSSEINFLGTRSFTNQTKKQENFIQIHPFGKKFLLKDGLVYDSGLLPFFELQGALFFGLEAKEFPEEFSMLFEIAKNNGGFHGDAPKLDWFYLANDDWKPFKQEDILFDSSFGLTRSGIISFKSPKDINLNNLVMPNELFWICCRTKDQQPMVSVISGIYMNAFAAKAILDKEIQHDPVLPAFSIESFEDDFPGLLSVIQPIESSGGRASEEKSPYYRRVSESLKHKFRAVTRWDIEKMLLQEFNWLGFVQVFGNFGHENFVAPGEVIVVGIPKIEQTGNFYLPKLNPGQLKEMELYLKKEVNPFVDFKVINPQYEYLMIKGKIKFNTSDTGLLFKKLYQELLLETCPWFYDDISSAFNQRETKRAEILNLITSRTYVKFFTSFSLAQMYENEQGEYQFVDGALLDDGMETVNIGKPWSILIPYPLKKIDLVDEENYLPAEAFDLEDMVIGENLIITAEYVETVKDTGVEPMKADDEAFYHFNFKF
jgi:hypothetical protein